MRLAEPTAEILKVACRLVGQHTGNYLTCEPDWQEVGEQQRTPTAR